MADFSISVGSRGGCIILNEYEGEFSLISGYEGRDGNEYWNMVFRRDSKTKEPTGKAIPQKVAIGPPPQAAAVLRQFADYLDKNVAGQPKQPAPRQSSIPDEDIPW